MNAVRVGVMDGLPGLEKLFKETLGEMTLQVLVAFTALRLEWGWHRTPVNVSRLIGLS